jgi:hypothetical protein
MPSAGIRGQSLSRQPDGTDTQKQTVLYFGYRYDIKWYLKGSSLFARLARESVYHPPKGGCFTALSRSLNTITRGERLGHQNRKQQICPKRSTPEAEWKQKLSRGRRTGGNSSGRTPPPRNQCRLKTATPDRETHCQPRANADRKDSFD